MIIKRTFKLFSFKRRKRLFFSIKFFVEVSILHKGVNYSLKREHIVNITSNTLLEEIDTFFLENGETKIYKNTSEENKSVIYRMIESWISEKMLNYFSWMEKN